MKIDLKFGESLNPKFFFCTKNKVELCENITAENSVITVSGGVEAKLDCSNTDNGFSYRVTVKNNSQSDFSPESFGLDLGIDTYLESYPQWNEKFFPTFFRCEKTHFYGYFMSPNGEILGVFAKQPVASYLFDYNKEPGSWGHRINFAGLVFFNSQPLPEHHSQNFTCLKAGETSEWEIFFERFGSLEDYIKALTEKYSMPYFNSEKFTLAIGEELKPSVICKGEYKLSITAPDGTDFKGGTVGTLGLYKAEIESACGFKATAHWFCRESWEWYMKNARKEVILKPPHATTHCESWYGFYTGFLAEKHYPDTEPDNTVQAMFDEIMPYAFNFHNCRPKLITERIQNVSTIIGVLTDRYECNPKKYPESLMQASKFADWLITRQRSDGGYYRDNTHYTCVIYPAKSMLELVSAEEKASETNEYYKKAAKRHFESASRAIEDLVERLEDIGTEGEHTLEDGMISCSCLQIACYALLLPENKRKKYIDAAEHMLKVHRCLEHQISPDCRVRGTTVRYWEAQYDVMLRRNFITSPHGWSAWLMYALYYLYLLTGKEEYLTQFMDGMGACAQLLNLNGDLKWAFVVDPYAYADQQLVPDKSQPIHDAYRSVKTEEPAYRGKFKESVVGEEYVDMISGWYRTSRTQKVTGGFYTCPLFLADGETIRVDRQGGCCDNDVHEIFKCMEETVLKKAFLLERDDGSLLCYNCKAERKADTVEVISLEEISFLHVNLKNPANISVCGKKFSLPDGMKMLEI